MLNTTNYIATSHPLIMSGTPDNALDPGYPLVFDLAMEQPSDENAGTLAKNIGQMLRENPDAGFLCLQSLPANATFKKTLNEALVNTGWKIAESIAPSNKVMTLHNSRLYAPVPGTPDPDLGPVVPNALCEAHQLHCFKPQPGIDVPSITIANMSYGDVDAKTVANDFEKFKNQYEDDFSLIFAGNLGADLASNAEYEDDNSFPLVNSGDDHCSSAIIFDNAFREKYDNDQVEAKADPGLNTSNSAVYDLPDDWDSEDIEKLLTEKGYIKLPTMGDTTAFSKEVLEKMQGNENNVGSLSVFSTPTSIAALLADSEADSTPFHYAKAIANDLITKFRENGSEWNIANLPSEIRLAIPVQWDGNHFSPLCLTLSIDDKHNLLELVNNDELELTAENIRNCFSETKAQLFESTISSDLEKEVNGRSVRDALENMLKAVFVNNEDQNHFEIENSVPMLQRKGVDAAGTWCNVLTAMHADDFLHGREPKKILGFGEEGLLYKNYNDWDPDQRKAYASTFEAFILRKKREYAIDLGIGLKPDSSKSQAADSNPTDANPANYAAKMRGMNYFRNSPNLTMEAGKVVKTNPDGSKTDLLEIKKDKNGSITITQALLPPSNPEKEKSAPPVYVPVTAATVRAQLMAHLYHGHDPENQKLYISTTESRQPLWASIADSLGFDLKNIIFGEIEQKPKPETGLSPRMS